MIRSIAFLLASMLFLSAASAQAGGDDDLAKAKYEAFSLRGDVLLLKQENAALKAQLKLPAATQPSTAPADPGIVAAQAGEIYSLKQRIAALEQALAAKYATAPAVPPADPTDRIALDTQPPPATPPASSAPPTEQHTPGQTYVGPRGGVYHYSASGNKVYSRHK